MSKSRFVIDKFAKLFEQGLLTSKDLGNEILNILKSKRDEIVFKMKLTSKDETDILNKRVEKLELIEMELKAEKEIRKKAEKHIEELVNLIREDKDDI